MMITAFGTQLLIKNIIYGANVSYNSRTGVYAEGDLVLKFIRLEWELSDLSKAHIIYKKGTTQESLPFDIHVYVRDI